MDIPALSAILGSVFTGISVLLALVIYMRTSDRESFSRFRLHAREFEQSLHDLKGSLDEATLAELASRATDRLAALFPAEVSVEQFISFMVDDRHRSYILDAMLLGYRDAEARRELSTFIRAIRRLPHEFRDKLPVLARVTETAAFHLTKATEEVVSPQMFTRVLGTPELFEETAIPRIKVLSSPAYLFPEVASLLTQTSQIAAEQRRDVLSASIALLELLLRSMLELSDRELQRTSRRQHRHAGRQLWSTDPRDSARVPVLLKALSISVPAPVAAQLDEIGRHFVSAVEGLSASRENAT